MDQTSLLRNLGASRSASIMTERFDEPNVGISLLLARDQWRRFKLHEPQVSERLKLLKSRHVL
jgi:hypothetical protein